jgi:8-oxo-dGTP diphosphatase
MSQTPTQTPTTPALTVDVIIEMHDRPNVPVVLIERRFAPFGWALPGGFVDVGERLEDAARRESKEETGLDVELSVLLGCYSDPARDPRGHTVSAVYVGRAEGIPEARDDARSVELFDPEHTPPLAFDHARIIRDYLIYRQSGQRTPLR